MKVKVENYCGFEREAEELAEFVASELVDDSYESGQIEKLDHTQDNVLRVLGVLIDILVSRRIIGHDDIKRLLRTYKEFKVLKED